jgi:tRNA A37 threonylcarbamoyladenosine biosynthesis protein TsaE
MIIEDINDNEKVVIVEWPDIILNDLPDKKLVIEIKTINESERKISLNLTKDLNYLVEGVV